MNPISIWLRSVFSRVQDIELAATGGSAITLKEAKDAKDEKDEKEKERREREKEASKEAERERRERKEREKEREKKSDPAAERRAKEAEERLRQSGMAKWLVDLKDVEFHKKIGQVRVLVPVRALVYLYLYLYLYPYAYLYESKHSPHFFFQGGYGAVWKGVWKGRDVPTPPHLQNPTEL